MGVSPGFLRRESLIQISLTYFDERWLANSDRGWKATMNQPDPILRITSNPAILAGKPVIRGTRISVEFILNLLAHGATNREILAEYNGLRDEDIQACLLFASKSLSNTSFMPLSVEPA